MDKIAYFDEGDRFLGKVNFHSGFLNSHIVLAVRDVEGVDRMCSDAWKVRRLFRKSLRAGVAVHLDFDGIVIDVCIWTKYGYSAADVSYRVQESVINVITDLEEDRTRNVKNVNVRINGVQQKEVS